MNLYTRLSTGALPSQKYFALAHTTPERQWQNPAFRFIAGALGTHVNTYRLHVNLPELSLIRRWIQQSDILQHAYLTARYVAWRSAPELLKGLHIGIQSRW